MKLFLPIVALLFASVFSACKPDEKQLQRVWKVKKVFVGKRLMNQFFIEHMYTEEYLSNGVYKFSGDSANKSGEGKWEFIGNTLRRSEVSNQPSRDLKVLKLTKNDFHYEMERNGEVYTFEFERANKQ